MLDVVKSWLTPEGTERRDAIVSDLWNPSPDEPHLAPLLASHGATAIDQAQVRDFVLPLGTGISAIRVVQLSVYLKPTYFGDHRAWSTPPIVWAFVQLSRADEDRLVDLLERLAALWLRVYRDHHQPLDLRTAQTLQRAVDLMTAPRLETLPNSEGVEARSVLAELSAARRIIALHRLRVEGLALHSRGDIESKLKTLTSAASSLAGAKGSHPPLVVHLLAPVRHHALGLLETLDGVRAMDDHARSALDLVTAGALARLIDRTEGARMTGLVVALIAGAAAIASVVAALAAIPAAQAPALLPLTCGVGAAATGITLFGLLLARLAARPGRETAHPALAAYHALHEVPDGADVWHHRVEVGLLAMATIALSTAAVRDSLPLALLGGACVAMVLLVTARFHSY